MNFIKKIINKEIDESVHLQFQKFSGGEFKNRALIQAKQSKGKISINTSAEFANELIRIAAEKIQDKTVRVTGAVVSTNDLKNDLEFKEIKQFQGVKRYLIDKEMSGKDILKLLDKFPKTFFALSFEMGEDKLKIKPKAPKSGKPGSTRGEKPKADFCKIITTDINIGKNFVFEKPDFKEAHIVHDYFIEEIIIPKELKDEKNYAKVREMSKRKGKIIRKSEIDGQTSERIIEFEV